MAHMVGTFLTGWLWDSQRLCQAWVTQSWTQSKADGQGSKFGGGGWNWKRSGMLKTAGERVEGEIEPRGKDLNRGRKGKREQ